LRAVHIAGAGGPEVLEWREQEEPAPGPEDVLVRVHASALNRADVLQRMGRYPAPPGVPAQIPGLEYAGEVVRCGSRVSLWRTGERVMGLVAGGAHAEYVVAHERTALRIPPALSWEEAAAFPEAFLTAYDALFTRGGLRPGEALLLTAAASGVGTAASQVASCAGARVIGLSRSADKRARLTSLGVAHALDPATPDLPAAVRSLAAGAGADLALDLVGGPGIATLMEALAPRGRLVLVGLLAGTRADIDLARLLSRRLTMVGTVLRSRPLEEKIALAQEVTHTLLPLLAAGRIRPVIDRVVPMAEIARAHAALERDETFGKIVLRP
jgi:putative PIG3 family NAD(P)H quinone oxidoreductase